MFDHEIILQKRIDGKMIIIILIIYHLDIYIEWLFIQKKRDYFFNIISRSVEILYDYLN